MASRSSYGVVNFVKCAWLAVVCEFRMYVVKRIILNVSAAGVIRCHYSHCHSRPGARQQSYGTWSLSCFCTLPLPDAEDATPSESALSTSGCKPTTTSPGPPGGPIIAARCPERTTQSPLSACSWKERNGPKSFSVSWTEFSRMGLCACAQLYLLRWASTKHAITK
jgi:hypothetical protein